MVAEMGPSRDLQHVLQYSWTPTAAETTGAVSGTKSFKQLVTQHHEGCIQGWGRGVFLTWHVPR